MASPKGFIVYRIYYGDTIVYVGRTKQPLQSRIHNHFHKSAFTMLLDINYVSKIEYTMFNTAADMAVAEVYYINKYHSMLNKDDHMKDNLTFDVYILDNMKWTEFIPVNWDKWKLEYRDVHPTKRKNKYKNKRALEEVEISIDDIWDT